MTDVTNGDQTRRMNLGDGAGSPTGWAEFTAPAFSADGRFLAFMDNAASNSGALPYLYDFSTGARTAISLHLQDGSPAPIAGGLQQTEHSYGDDGFAISPSGRFVAFRVLESVVVEDMWAGKTTVPSSGPNETDPNALASFGSAPSFAADGSVLIFSSQSSNLYYQDRNESNSSGGGDDIFAYVQTVTPHASGAIAGTVTGPSGPLLGVTVYIDANHNGLPDDPNLTMTANDGTYEILGLGAGTYSVNLARPDGFGFNNPANGLQNVTLASDSSTAGGTDFLLEAATGSISGQVSVPTGVPLEYWGVDIDTNHNYVADDPVHGVTAANGTYDISNLPKGTYRVFFQASDGYAASAPAANTPM